MNTKQFNSLIQTIMNCRTDRIITKNTHDRKSLDVTRKTRKSKSVSRDSISHQFSFFQPTNVLSTIYSLETRAPNSTDESSIVVHFIR